MPLRDHFRPPLEEQRPWRSFHATWCSALADLLNSEVLPPGYLALEYVSPGPAIEIDIGTFTGGPEPTERNGSTATIARAVWTPTLAPVVLPFDFATQATVAIHETGGGRALVAAIELVSPGNRDRETKRRQFTAKCVTHLANGVGLVVVDVVTTRTANLHAEVLTALGQAVPENLPPLYATAYRPLTEGGVGRIDCWPMALAIGEPLPTVPLSLAADCCIAVDLEAAYVEAGRRRRLDEV